MRIAVAACAAWRTAPLGAGHGALDASWFRCRHRVRRVVDAPFAVTALGSRRAYLRAPVSHPVLLLPGTHQGDARVDVSSLSIARKSRARFQHGYIDLAPQLEAERLVERYRRAIAAPGMEEWSLAASLDAG